MPVISKTLSGARSYLPDTRGSVPTDRIQMTNAGGIRELAENAAAKDGANYSSDDMKYVVATKLAQNNLSGFGNVDDRRMKEEIDRNFQDLGGTVSGADYRGETPFSQAVSMAKSGIDGFNNLVGQGLDAAFDFGVGGVADILDSAQSLASGKKMGLRQNTENMFTPEDLSIISDIGTDVALSMIPGAGIPLVMAKNAIQQSDNLYEALTGKDSVTNLSLEGSQRGGKAAEAAMAPR